MVKTPDKTAETVSNVMNTLFRRFTRSHWITGAQIYFARPYASYQRGTNENTNGLVRRQWPKGTALGSLTEQDASELELRLNMTPRKVLMD
ncbi:hypothetical protein KKI93_20660 [Xenorhabdus bovienii]|uniref:hypothetical protein n=1 Tax=Xenorhabdus bovienii TaxID=40576 RepID=UPI0023B25CCC|nr:hypothetical protein [Xenorhabdus bovienii]MDE9566377.1 hypothetical protein [Xenorhabdus bovienii]